ncbi:MAG TPA: LysR family transcriptional regulator substrate-binding protein [Ktedonobacteraceae bacterium]|nr:LysR family transcriptional regulator substrate-binding protein [Ktedonobacteraceae bacterium]
MSATLGEEIRSPRHRLAGQETIPLREVAHEAVVIEKVGSGLRDLVDTFCQQAGFTPRIVYEIDEPAALYEFVKAYLGVAFVPALMKKQIREQALLSLRLTNPICQRTFGIAWHEEHYLSEAARTFHQFIMDHFADLEQEARSLIFSTLLRKRNGFAQDVRGTIKLKGVEVRREEPGNLDNGDLTHFFSGCDTMIINLIDS